MKEINKNSFDIVSLVAAVDVMLAHTIANAGGGKAFILAVPCPRACCSSDVCCIRIFGDRIL